MLKTWCSFLSHLWHGTRETSRVRICRPTLGSSVWSSGHAEVSRRGTAGFKRRPSPGLGIVPESICGQWRFSSWLLSFVELGQWASSNGPCHRQINWLRSVQQITGMDKRGRVRAFQSSWWELNSEVEEVALKRDWNNPSRPGSFPLIKGRWNTQKNENWFGFDASSYVFVASKEDTRINLPVPPYPSIH